GRVQWGRVLPESANALAAGQGGAGVAVRRTNGSRMDRGYSPSRCAPPPVRTSRRVTRDTHRGARVTPPKRAPARLERFSHCPRIRSTAVRTAPCFALPRFVAHAVENVFG